MMEQGVAASRITSFLKGFSLPAPKIESFAKIMQDASLKPHERLVKMFPKPRVQFSPNSKAFMTEYNDSNDAKSHYIRFVRSSFALFMYTSSDASFVQIYSLYSAIVQSSGYGKSRLVTEAAKRDLNTLYCNMNQSDQGYPLPNKNLFDFLSTKSDIESLKVFLMLCYREAFEIVRDHEEKSDFLPLYQKYPLEGTSALFEGFWDIIIAKYPSALQEVDSLKSFFDSQQALYVDSFIVEDQVSGYHKATVKNGLATNSRGEIFLPELVIIFDEAKSLLEASTNEDRNVFRNLRAALKEIKSFNVMILFMDTLSSVSNFVPASIRDPSRRNLFIPTILLPPFYEVLTYDVLADQNDDETYKRYSDCIKLFGQGRPLWLTTYNNNCDTTSNVSKEPIMALVAFAKQKLLCFESKALGLPLDINPRDAKENPAAIAVMSIRFGIEGVMDHTLASSLMAGHMGTGT